MTDKPLSFLEQRREAALERLVRSLRHSGDPHRNPHPDPRLRRDPAPVEIPLAGIDYDPTPAATQALADAGWRCVTPWDRPDGRTWTAQIRRSTDPAGMED